MKLYFQRYEYDSWSKPKTIVASSFWKAAQRLIVPGLTLKHFKERYSEEVIYTSKTGMIIGTNPEETVLIAKTKKELNALREWME